MKLKEGIMISEVGGEFVAVPCGESAKEFSGMIRMNATAAAIAKMLQNGIGAEDIIQALCEEYDVDEQTVRRDYAAVVAQLDGLGLIDHD